MTANTFSSGTSGATVDATTTAADGDAATIEMTTGVGVALTYSKVGRMRGQMGMKVSGTDGSSKVARWNHASANASFSTIIGMYMTAYPTISGFSWGRWRTSSAAASTLNISTGGVFNVQNRSGSAGGTNGGFPMLSGSPLPLNTFLWIKVQGTRATATTGTLACQIYGDDPANTLLSTNSRTDVDLGTGDIDRFQIGKVLTGGAAEIYIDSFESVTGSTPLAIPTRPKLWAGIYPITKAYKGTDEIDRLYAGETRVA